jgi:hypothetical protein
MAVAAMMAASRGPCAEQQWSSRCLGVPQSGKVLVASPSPASDRTPHILADIRSSGARAAHLLPGRVWRPGRGGANLPRPGR